MTSPTPSTKLRDESGFTLVELLVAMMMSAVILFGVLNTLDHFSSNAARQTKVTDANDQVRKAMDRIVSDLRQAATVDVAAGDDLVYTVRESATTIRQERVCLDDNRYLWRTSATSVGSVTAIANGSPCPMPSAGGAKITPLKSGNDETSNPIFTYDSATPANVRSVGLTVALNAGSAGRSDVSTLRASTFVRAESETALDADDDDISSTCNKDTRVPTLKLDASVAGASVQYLDSEGHTLGSGSAGSTVTLSSATPTATTVIAKITSSTGLVSQLVKTLECPT
jgi:prepilin-type N-terminal cleavage/methylation domain-containing protein